MHDESARVERITFLTMAIFSEGCLISIALVLGWLVGRPAWSDLKLSFESIGLGIVATFPLLLVLTLIYQSRAKSLVRFRDLVRDLIGKPLTVCGWFDLCAIALLAGVSEEFLFRGVLEPWLGGWGPLFGLVVCNVIFGLCHAITRTYFVFATLVGMYLSMTLWWTREPNLVVPICCHALYDLVAFVVVRNSYRKADSQFPPDDGLSATNEDTPNYPVFPVNQ